MRHPGRDSQGPRLLPDDNHLLGRGDNDCHCYAFLPTVLRCYGRHFLFAFFSAPEGAASVLSHSGVALRSSGLDSCLRKDHAPEKDASVKCFDAVLGKVRLPCLRFIAVRIVPGRWILASTLSYCVCGICSNNTALCDARQDFSC